MSHSISDPVFWGFGIWFLLAFISSCYFPGSWLIARFKLTPLRHYLVSLVLGVVLWGAQGYLLGYLGLRWLSYGYIALFSVLTAQAARTERQRLVQTWQYLRHQWQNHWLPVLLTLLGSSIQLIQVVGSGLYYPGQGIAFFRVNAFDGMLHLSFINSIIRHFPPEQPGAVGFPITNYHYWSDLVVAELARVWSLPVAHSFFQYWPVVLTVLTSLAAYFVIKTWTGSRVAANFSVFFLFFGADTAYLVMLLLHQEWGFTAAAIDNGATQFLNIPHSFAKLIFLTGLLPLTEWIHSRRWQWGLLTIAFFAPVVGFKVYFGMFACLGLCLIVSWKVLRDWISGLRTKSVLAATTRTLQNHLSSFLVLGICGVIALSIFLPPNRNAGSLFWSPLEWPKLFLSRDQLDLQDWWLRKQVYEAAGNTKAIVALDAVAIGICLLAVYGTRLIGLSATVTWRKQLPLELWLFLIPGTLLFTLLGLYTLQTSGLFNVFNFFAVASVPLALLSSIVTWQLWNQRRIWGKLSVLILMCLSLPRIGYHAVQALQDQVEFHYQELYSLSELEALVFLRDHTPTGAVVQSHTRNYLDQNTPYLSFFSNRPTFLTGVGMLQSHNQPIQSRKLELDQIISSTSSLELSNLLKAHGIEYFYLQKKPDQLLGFSIEPSNMEIVFENETVVILQPR